MTLIREIVAELFGMFMGDLGLSLGIFAVVAVAAAVAAVPGLSPLVPGGALLLGCLAVLVAAVFRAARR